LDKVYFVSGGSEANECALKMARQYYVEIGQPERINILARQQSYHGNTIETLAVGCSPARRKAFEPILVQNVTHLSPCYTYRGMEPGETEVQYGERLAQEFEDAVEKLGPETIMCFIAETVGGATAGVITPVPGYFKRIRELCDKYGILLILDEVMCGMGRTGAHFTYTQEGILPDMVTNAKGLGAGYQPIGSVTVSAAIHDAFVAGSGAFSHGHTYVGHPTACAAALAVQTEVDRRGLIEAVGRLGHELETLLQDRFADRPWCGDLRGRGLFRGIELVADKETKAPFDPNLKLSAKVKAAAMDRGLICYPGSGTINGREGDHVLLAPPFILESKHLEELVDKLDGAITAAVSQ
jgi:adenosylmethionine-8-amino-7-oxononanoate aminotransferase